MISKVDAIVQNFQESFEMLNDDEKGETLDWLIEYVDSKIKINDYLLGDLNDQS